jgi:hypothetical protein
VAGGVSASRQSPADAHLPHLASGRSHLMGSPPPITNSRYKPQCTSLHIACRYHRCTIPRILSYSSTGPPFKGAPTEMRLGAFPGIRQAATEQVLIFHQLSRQVSSIAIRRWAEILARRQGEPRRAWLVRIWQIWMLHCSTRTSPHYS